MLVVKESRKGDKTQELREKECQGRGSDRGADAWMEGWEGKSARKAGGASLQKEEWHFSIYGSKTVLEVLETRGD